MAGNEIHYEIFRRHGAKGGWILHDVTPGRDAAIAMAENLVSEQGATGAKVVKETYNPDTGDYLSLKIFEDGHNRVRVKPQQEDVPHALPCFKPDDLYSYHARTTIARLISDWLARHRLTVTELLHRADMIEKFEATGTVFQHAVQKIAVAQAASTTTPVQQIIKTLNDLATNAMHRVYRDERKKLFPRAAAGEFGPLAGKLAGNPAGAYLLNAAIARHLAPSRGWDDKLRRLLALMHELPDDGPARGLLLGAVDAIVAEILNGSAALADLLGPQEDLGGALRNLVELFLGDKVTSESAEGLNELARHFARDELPEARTAIANRILAELKSVKRLCPGSLENELTTLRRLANMLVRGQGKYLSHDDLIAAFTLRSRRLVMHETIGEWLDGAKEQDEKLERLLVVEENIIGAENKRQLGSFVMPLIASPAFESRFVFAKTPVLQRLQRLAILQSRVRRSGFQENQREQIAAALDAIAAEAEGRAKLFETIDAKPTSHSEKALAILKLCAAGALTEGRVAGKARALAISYLGRPGFLTGYVARRAGAEGGTGAEAAVAELKVLLGRAGIEVEQALKEIAA